MHFLCIFNLNSALLKPEPNTTLIRPKPLFGHNGDFCIIIHFILILNAKRMKTIVRFKILNWDLYLKIQPSPYLLLLINQPPWLLRLL